MLLYICNKEKEKEREVEYMYLKKVKAVNAIALESAKEELFQAKERLEQKRTNFDNALPEFFEVANMELDIAEQQLRACIMKVRLLTP